jgi:glycosyltransferase involved in cell wall biosynthesis
LKIAVVGPSPVPFRRGGAENLLSGIVNAINTHTHHEADLIKLPSRELSFWELIDNYLAFYKLDLSHFDAIVSTKYPSWMVRHPNHICYMFHKLRGLYDMYREPLIRFRRSAPAKGLRDLLCRVEATDDDFQTVVEALESLRQLGTGEPPFPGPLIRETVHYFDSVGLSPAKIRRYYAISSNVKSRPDYFPPEARVEVVYPPPSLPNLRSEKYEYIFTTSRLDPQKRIHLIVEAMRHVNADVQLIVEGSGPEEEKLNRLRSKDRRIEFIRSSGYTDLVELYSRALAVVFVPQDEDLGLVTLEAMRSAKPVITCSDSGGPLEFVRHMENGLVAEPNPLSLSNCIKYVVQHKDEAEAMGKRAQESIRWLTWETAVKSLVNGLES